MAEWDRMRGDPRFAERLLGRGLAMALLEAVERFVEPACTPIQNGAEDIHFQQQVEFQLRIRDLIH